VKTRAKHAACSCGRVWKEGPSVYGTLPPCPLGAGCTAKHMCGARPTDRSHTRCRLVLAHDGAHEEDGFYWTLSP
jgi:hypothetical protein